MARAAPDLVLVRHEAVDALGMAAMEMMAVRGEPAVIDAAGVSPGDRVRLGVRQRGQELLLLRLERVR